MKIYIATMSNSEVDRIDIIYVGKSETAAEDALWTAYCEFYGDNDYDNTIGKKYKSKKEFTDAAKQEFDSAYIQFNHSHLNFELHCEDADI